jgi:hypothetical protein
LRTTAAVGDPGSPTCRPAPGPAARSPSPVFESAPTSAILAALLCGCCVLAGCGAGSQASRRSSEIPAGEQAQLASPSHRASDTTPLPRFFAPTSVWNQAVAANAPVDRSSAGMVAGLVQEVAHEEAAGTGPWINTTSDGVPIVTVPAAQPTVRVVLDHAPDAALSSAWSAVPLPTDAQPAQGSDGELALWQPSSNRMWEFWRLNRQGDGWHASWGGAMRHVSTNPGVYGPGAWPGAKPWWGVSASSLALVGGVMTIQELGQGRIDHALAIAIPDVRMGVFASPAHRTDGTSQSQVALPEGAHLVIDPHLNLASLRMPPVARMIALAAQRYGIIVRDFAGNVAFVGEDPSGDGANPYEGATGFFSDEDPAQVLAAFPWSHLEVLKLSLHGSQ